MILRISGRLGNQMFQYATVKAFRERYHLNEDIKLDFSLNQIHSDTSFQDALKDFQVSDYKIIEQTKWNISQMFIFSIYRFQRFLLRYSKKPYYEKQVALQKRWQKKLNYFGIYHFLYGYYAFSNSRSKNKIFEGYFESAKYFNEIREQLLNDFTPKSEKLEHNKFLYQAIETSESVCVTIRRGDFLDEKNKGRFYICTPEYFEKGIQKMQTLLNHPKFIVFSDDIEWCKKNMNFPKGTLFERGDDPVWEKLRLMYSCKHFIISNSTFSWWAQYLSRNPKKIVIAPKKWSNEGNYWKDLYDDDWILL